MELSKFQDKRAGIIAKLILDRKFDIPVEIYDELDDTVLMCFISKHEEIMEELPVNKKAQDFFRHIQDGNVPRSKFHDKCIFDICHHNGVNPETDAIVRMLLFTEHDWRKHFRLNNRRMGEYDMEQACIALLHDLIVAVTNKLFHHRLNLIANLFHRYMQNNKTLMMSLLVDRSGLFPDTNHLVDIAYAIGCNKDYLVSVNCLYLGIPVLFYHATPETVDLYLNTVIRTKYTGLLDPNISEQVSLFNSDDDKEYYNDFSESLYWIGLNLNKGNLKYYYLANKYTAIDSAIISNLTKIKVADEFMIKDFRDIVTIIGSKGSGLSIELQKLFLTSGGDIETMFDENGKLLPEASILKSAEELPNLLKILSEEVIRFLLLNCPEFTKNIIVSDGFGIVEYTKIARALLVYPVDTELYDILNPEDLSGTTDYRAYIINMIIVALSKDVLFDAVPESMAYIEPSVAYILDNLTYEMVPYVPIHRIAHSTKQIIARNPHYQKFNLYDNGDYVSILDAVDGNIQFMIDEIIKGKKYGYICDLKNGQNIHEIIDMVTNLVIEKE